MTTVEHVLHIAAGELGVTERPANSNKTKYGAWYGLDGQPWCMMFVQWCFSQAGIPLPKRTASCGDLMRTAQAAGCCVTQNFQPGDVAIYDFSGRKKTTEHCGIVECVLPGYGVQAIEGNTSQSGSQSNGGQVCRKKRAGSCIIGAVRPVFPPECQKEPAMTGKEIYDALQDYLSKQPVPNWAKAELEEAVKLGITDGSSPMQLIPRYQAALMAKRAAEAGSSAGDR